MTNEIVTTLELMTREPFSAAFVIWVVALILMPIVSVIAYLKHWSASRQKRTLYWEPRVILLAALIVAVLTLVEITLKLQLILYIDGTMTPGDAQQAMVSVSLLFCCRVFTLGLISTAFCLCARLMLPPSKEN